MRIQPRRLLIRTARILDLPRKTRPDARIAEPNEKPAPMLGSGNFAILAFVAEFASFMGGELSYVSSEIAHRPHARQ